MNPETPVTSRLARLNVTRKNGTEQFHSDHGNLAFTLLDFWQWSVSDLVSNATRGRLAEFIVAQALGISTDGIRDEWQAYDLQTDDGFKIEVKSAAFVQSWHQKQLCPVVFNVPPTRGWDAETNILSKESRRQADLYVFALLKHTDKSTVDPLNVDQWEFFVLPTKALNERTRSQHSITLKSLQTLCGQPMHFSDLADALRTCRKKQTPERQPP